MSFFNPSTYIVCFFLSRLIIYAYEISLKLFWIFFKAYGKILASHACEILKFNGFNGQLNPKGSESKTGLLSAAVVRDVPKTKVRSM